MKNSLFYSHIKENSLNKSLISSFEKIASENTNQQIYLISSPLGEKYQYLYEDNVVVILSPKHRIIFLNLVKDRNDDFEEYFEDFIEDLSYISDKYDYKKHIGRPREWKKDFTLKVTYEDSLDIVQLLEENKLKPENYRVGELLISLLVGSINDIVKIGVTEPDNILDRVKQNIILFDGEQTRFIFQKFNQKTVSIQGLSGTGKTELLLHKLKELYIKEDNTKIFFTCHNIALANTLQNRIPDFYDFHFLRYNSATNYNTIFSKALEHINNIPKEKFKYAFDYILVDERQDFPKVFFELCEKITKKQVYIAGDIFQDIFENTKETELEVDIILNNVSSI